MSPPESVETAYCSFLCYRFSSTRVRYSSHHGQVAAIYFLEISITVQSQVFLLYDAHQCLFLPRSWEIPFLFHCPVNSKCHLCHEFFIFSTMVTRKHTKHTNFKSMTQNVTYPLICIAKQATCEFSKSTNMIFIS